MLLWSSSFAVSRQSMSNSSPFRSCRRRMTTPPSPSHPPWKPCHSTQKKLSTTLPLRRQIMTAGTGCFLPLTILSVIFFLKRNTAQVRNRSERWNYLRITLPYNYDIYIYIYIVSRYRKANIYQIFSELNHFLSIYLTCRITSEQKITSFLVIEYHHMVRN